MIKVHAALVTVGIIYGANYSIAKSLMPNFIEPNGFIVLRVAGAFVFFYVLQKQRVRESITDKGDLLRIAICAMFGVAGNMLLFFNGLSLTSPINASVIMTVNPLLVLLFSALLLKERVTGLKILGIAVGMVGAILQITDPLKVGNEVESVNWRGDLLVLANATAYAAYLVLVKPLMSKYHTLTVVRYAFGFGVLMVLPFGLEDAVNAKWALMDWGIALRLLFVIGGTTILAYLLNAWSLRHVASSVVGAYIYLQPVFASLIAIFLANYQATWQMLVYALCIFAGVYMVSFPTKRKMKTAHG